MKKFVAFCVVLCLLIPFFTFFVSASSVKSTDPSDSLDVSNNEILPGIDDTAPILGTAQLFENAKSALLYDISSDTLMYAWNADTQLYPSSLVKIMTALLAIEKGNLSDVVTVKESTISTIPYNAVSAELQADEQITLEALLYCMMVGSANDAAAVIAEHISGSQDQFVQEMNIKAADLGCANSKFMNVHGLHHDEQYSTARDIGRILSAAMKNETFCKIFSTVKYSIPATNKSGIRDLSTGNFLMNTDDMEIYFDARVTGGRTGVAQDGTRCLAASAEGNGLNLISIVMGSEDVVEDDGYTTTIYGGYKETTQLFDKGLDGFKAVVVLYPGQAVCQLDVIDGINQVVLGSNVSVSALLPADVGLDNLTFRYTNSDEIRAPIKSGDALSSVEVWNGNTCVATADLYAMNSVKTIVQEQADAENIDNGNTAKVILIILVVIIGGAILVFVGIRILPNINRFLRKRRMRRFRRNRRRSR